MTIQELKDLVRLKIAGQGTMVDAGGALPPVLNGILDTLAATQNVESVVVTVDGGEGKPSADATFADGVLTLAFHNLKGEKGDQGNTGSSVDYPFELVNNVTTDDATKALSAAQGVVLDGKVSQLGQEVIGGEQEFTFTANSVEHSSLADLFPVNVPAGSWVDVALTQGTGVCDGSAIAIYLYDSERQAVTSTGAGPARVYCPSDIAYVGVYLYRVTTYGTFTIKFTAPSIKGDVARLKETSLTGSFIGRGNTYVSADIYGLAPGGTYICALTNLPWDTTGIPSSDSYLFAIQNFYNGAATDTFVVVSASQTISAVKPFYYFTLPANSDYVRIGGRAAASTLVNFQILPAMPSALNAPIGIPSYYSDYTLEYISSTRTLTLNRDTVLRNSPRSQAYKSNGANVEITIGADTSAWFIVYDKDADSYNAVRYDAALSPSQIVIAGLRTIEDSPSFCTPFPWSVDGKPYGINNQRGYTRGINHRGYNTVAPENTLPAFKLSRLKGFEVVECDVQFTSDNVPVLLHDASINRTATNADGTAIGTTVNIADITYEQALTYDFGQWKSAAYTGTKIPTFEQFIVLCRNLGLRPYVELKTGTQAQIEGLVDIAEQYEMSKKVTWISFSSTLLGYVKSKDDTARLGYLASGIDASFITATQSLQTNKNKVFIDSSTYTASEIALCKAANIPLEIWTINTISIVRNLDGYISGVTSDSLDAGKILYDANIN